LSNLHGFDPTGLSGRSFMRRLMDAVRGKVAGLSRRMSRIHLRQGCGGQGVLPLAMQLRLVTA